MNKMPFLVVGSEREVSGGYIYNRKIAENISWMALVYKSNPKDLIDYCFNQLTFAPHEAVLIDAWGLHEAPPIPSELIYYLVVHLPLALYDSCNAHENKAIQEYKIWEKAAGIVVPSEQVADFVRSKTQTKVVCVNPGVELGTTLRHTTKVQVGEEKKVLHINLIGLGTYVDKKGDELLIKALADVTVPFALTRIGAVVDQGYYAYLRTLIKRYELEDKIQLLKAIPHIEALEMLIKADLALFPTSYESYGMAIQESINLGVPVLVSNLPALRDRFGEDGVRYLDYTVQSWSAGIKQCFEECLEGKGLFESRKNMDQHRFSAWIQQSEKVAQFILGKSTRAN